MIEVKPSPTADTRSCDPATVSKEQLLESSRQHIADVGRAIEFFTEYMCDAKLEHDWDKIHHIDQFHSDFVGGFESTVWWDNHRKINRHHLAQEDGIPADVNLMDVLEYVADCVMAGAARSGADAYDPELSEEVLAKAFKNTVDLLKSQVILVED